MSETTEVMIEQENKYQKNVKVKMNEIKNISGFLGCISLVFGVIYTVCLYDNPSGITYPLFVIASYMIFVIILKKLHIKVKRQSWFLVVVSVFLAISTCRTGDTFLIRMNSIAIFLMTCIFMIQQFYDDRLWDFGKYIHSISLFLITALTLIGYPFQHGFHWLQQLKRGRCRYLVLVGIGVGCSLPIFVVLIFLLSESDAVFYNIVRYVMDSFLNPWILISVTVKTILGTLALYCLISGAYVKNLNQEVVDKRKQEPLLAISGLTGIALMYLIFCSIQVIFLFLGAGSLPEEMSYSSYARQGFFQLVFVVCINLVMVLLSLKYFKKNGILNVILGIISGCTFIMIASAAYRMLLYVGEYHLTYLRLLVLWFLAVITVLMAGIIILIYNNKFPLFRFSLVTVSFCYLALAWVRPDAVIAQYNVAHFEENSDGLYYLANYLSVDALPYILTLDDELSENWKREYYEEEISSYVNDMEIKRFNFSYSKASRLLKEK